MHTFTRSTYFVSILFGFSLIILMAFQVKAQTGYEDFQKGKYKSAFRKLKPLAEQGDAKAAFYLGTLYHLGKGVKKSDAEAIKWLKLSSEQKNLKAMSMLSDIYFNSEEVTQDVVQAFVWSSLALQYDSTHNKTGNELIFKYLDKEQLAEAEKLIKEYKKKLETKK